MFSFEPGSKPGDNPNLSASSQDKNSKQLQILTTILNDNLYWIQKTPWKIRPSKGVRQLQQAIRENPPNYAALKIIAQKKLSSGKTRKRNPLINALYRAIQQLDGNSLAAANSDLQLIYDDWVLQSKSALALKYKNMPFTEILFSPTKKKENPPASQSPLENKMSFYLKQITTLYEKGIYQAATILENLWDHTSKTSPTLFGYTPAQMKTQTSRSVARQLNRIADDVFIEQNLKNLVKMLEQDTPNHVALLRAFTFFFPQYKHFIPEAALSFASFAGPQNCLQLYLDLPQSAYQFIQQLLKIKKDEEDKQSRLDLTAYITTQEENFNSPLNHFYYLTHGTPPRIGFREQLLNLLTPLTQMMTDEQVHLYFSLLNAEEFAFVLTSLQQASFSDAIDELTTRLLTLMPRQLKNLRLPNKPYFNAALTTPPRLTEAINPAQQGASLSQNIEQGQIALKAILAENGTNFLKNKTIALLDKLGDSLKDWITPQQEALLSRQLIRAYRQFLHGNVRESSVTNNGALYRILNQIPTKIPMESKISIIKGIINLAWPNPNEAKTERRKRINTEKNTLSYQDAITCLQALILHAQPDEQRYLTYGILAARIKLLQTHNQDFSAALSICITLHKEISTQQLLREQGIINEISGLILQYGS